MTALGLATPIVMLEERGAIQALSRAWSLSRTQLPVVGLILLEYGLVYLFAALLLAVLGHLIGAPPLIVLLAHILDVLWPALLVAIYHGLAAEEAEVLGRH